MSKLLVIVGSTRPTRAADQVLPWLTRKTAEHAGFDTETIDLRDWPLPIFGEHFGTIGDVNDPTYSEPIVKAWNSKIKEADAYIIVTPEYNHSIPGGLKNAIDSVWISFGFRNKPVAFVGYSGGLGGGSPGSYRPCVPPARTYCPGGTQGQYPAPRAADFIYGQWYAKRITVTLFPDRP